MRTVKYYNIAVYKNQIKTSIPFLKILDDIIKIDWKNVVRKVNDSPMAMFPYTHLDPSHKMKRILSVGKFRQDYKPFLGKINTSVLEEIEQGKDVVELTTLIYDQTKLTAGIIYTREGANIKELEEYFTSFLPSNYEVRFEMLYYYSNIQEVYESHAIKGIEIQLKQNTDYGTLTKQNTNKTSSVLSALRMFYGTDEDLGGSVIKLAISTGRTKKYLDKPTILGLIEILNVDNEDIEKVEIKYETPTETKTINLKELRGHLSTKIFKNIEVPAYPDGLVVANELFLAYNYNSTKIEEAYVAYVENILEINESIELYEVPEFEYRVKME